MIDAIGIIAFITLIFSILASVYNAGRNKKATKTWAVRAAVAFFVLVLASYLSAAPFELSSVINEKLVFVKDIIIKGNLAEDSDALDLEEASKGILKVHYLDVGQGDAIFVQLPGGENLLIDGGGKEAGSFLVKYLKKQGAKRIEHLVITHPHLDHIGGLEEVVKSLPIDNIYMPRVSHSTKTFEDLMRAIKQKGLKIKEAKAGVKPDLGGEVQGIFLAPNKMEYKYLNDYSAVLKLTYKGVSVLFTGDAEEISEREMLEAGYDLKAEVLKLGHHGSSTSTCEEFLDAVAPEYGVISAGKNNDYGHPHRETLDKLNRRGIKVFRTDLQGTIILEVSESKVRFNKEPVELK